MVSRCGLNGILLDDKWDHVMRSHGHDITDTLTWVKNLKPKLFGYLLAQQIASNNDIDLADGVELVHSFGSNVGGFVNIIIKYKKELLE